MFGMKFEGLEPEEVARLIKLTPVLVAYRGSITHGMYTPTGDVGIDDVDLIECYVPGLEHYFGLDRGPSRGHDCKVKQYDMAAYEFRHFTGLLAQANPNVVSALWLKPEHYLHIGPVGELLVKNRKMFSSRRALDSFSGYAYSQLKRMTAYHDQGEDVCCQGEIHHEPGCRLAQERGRGSVKKFATGFMGAKRKALVEKHGYDTKNAAHLIRLLRMGIEFGETGELIVDRRDSWSGEGDAEQLLEIKRGEWSRDDVTAVADVLFAKLRVIKDEGKSPLPEQPDMKGVEGLVMDGLAMSLGTSVSLRAVGALRGR